MSQYFPGWWVLRIEGRLIGAFRDKGVALAVLNTSPKGHGYSLSYARGD